MYNPFGEVSGPRPKHSGAKPLPDNKDVWASEDWDDVKKRKLAAILHEATRGGDECQVLVDAIHQASSTSYFVPDRFLKRIEEAMSYDFEQRPHASIGEPPIGRPVEHLKLLAELKKLRASVDRLKTEAASERSSFTAHRVLSPAFKAFETLTRVLQAELEDIKSNEKELSLKHGGVCSCKVCFGITFQLKEIDKILGDCTSNADSLKRRAETAASLQRIRQQAAARQTTEAIAPNTPHAKSSAKSSRPAPSASNIRLPCRASLRPATCDPLERLTTMVEDMGRSMRQVSSHMPQLTRALDRIATRDYGNASAAQSFRRAEGPQAGHQARGYDSRLRLIYLKRELGQKETELAQCKYRLQRAPAWEKAMLLKFARERIKEVGELKERIRAVSAQAGPLRSDPYVL